MTRIRLDDMTDDQLDALYGRLEVADRALGAVCALARQWRGHPSLVACEEIGRGLEAVLARCGWSPPVPDPGPPGWPELTPVSPEGGV